MSIGKDKKIKKLTRQNIWAPILFFVVSFLTVCLMITACEGAFMTYLVENRFETACINATEVSTLIEKRLNKGESLEEIVVS